MNNQFFSQSVLDSFPKAAFQSKSPCPWHSFEGLLTADGFRRLHESFPALEHFEKHEGLARGYGQKSHDRFYLAYQKSTYHSANYRGPGVIQHDDLPKCWQHFLEELQSSRYREFMKSALKVANVKVRFAWHLAVQGSQVSPHLDVLEKAGLHLFYFNTSEDWKESWGGSTLLLDRPKRKAKNLEFNDFRGVTQIPQLGNRSLLLKNSRTAWHGVKHLSCPKDRYRRLFSVIFETPTHPAMRIKRTVAHLLKGTRKYPGER